MKREVIRRHGLASAISVFLLVGAVLPNVAYVGHAGAATSHSHPPAAAGGEEHALHCHTGPSGCAGAQAMVGAIWVGEDSGLLAPTSEARTAPDSSQPTTPEAPVIRVLDPPRAA